jgi:hypothetical protein
VVRFLFSLLFLFLLPEFSHSNESNSGFTKECFQVTQPIAFNYCIHQPNQKKSKNILYHLHGRGGSELFWSDSVFYTEQIRQHWLSKKSKWPTVVSVSFGKIWLLAERNQSPYSGLFEAFTGFVIPHIESQLGGLKGKRILLGESMGGFNSAQLSFKTNLFRRAAILCAPMSEVSPFAPEEEILAHVQKSTAWKYYQNSDPNLVMDTVKGSVQLARAFFPTPEDWANGNPLSLVSNFASKTKTEFYVAAGFYDKFALYEANQVFSETIKSEGGRVDWRPQWGGHCAIDIPTLANFLAK